jgi:hypothetical protein
LLTDDRAVAIVDAVTPLLHDGDYPAGITRGEQDMRQAVGDTDVTARAPIARPVFHGGSAVPAERPTSPHEATNPAVVGVTLALGGAILLGLFVLTVRGWDRPGYGGGGGGGGWGGATGAAGMGGGGGGGGAVGGGGGASGGF